MSETNRMTSAEREVFLNLAWFNGDTRFLGRDIRPLSLGSYKALGMMGVNLLDESQDGDELHETRQGAIYLWLHDRERSPEEISRCLWKGSWKAVEECQDQAVVGVVQEWQALRERLRAVIIATEIHIEPRERRKDDETPKNVVGPIWFAFVMSVVKRLTREDSDHIMWEMPLGKAMQFFHAELRWSNHWTVIPGERVDPDAFEDFSIEALKG